MAIWFSFWCSWWLSRKFKFFTCYLMLTFIIWLRLDPIGDLIRYSAWANKSNCSSVWLDYGKSLLVAAHSLVLRSISKSWHAHENNISTLIVIRLHTTLYQGSRNGSSAEIDAIWLFRAIDLRDSYDAGEGEDVYIYEKMMCAGELWTNIDVIFFSWRDKE